jgi:hypothetical protein
MASSTLPMAASLGDAWNTCACQGMCPCNECTSLGHQGMVGLSVHVPSWAEGTASVQAFVIATG